MPPDHPHPVPPRQAPYHPAPHPQVYPPGILPYTQPHLPPSHHPPPWYPPPPFFPHAFPIPPHPHFDTRFPPPYALPHPALTQLQVPSTSPAPASASPAPQTPTTNHQRGRCNCNGDFDETPPRNGHSASSPPTVLDPAVKSETLLSQSTHATTACLQSNEIQPHEATSVPIRRERLDTPASGTVTISHAQSALAAWSAAPSDEAGAVVPASSTPTCPQRRSLPIATPEPAPAPAASLTPTAGTHTSTAAALSSHRPDKHSGLRDTIPSVLAHQTKLPLTEGDRVPAHDASDPLSDEGPHTLEEFQYRFAEVVAPKVYKDRTWRDTAATGGDSSGDDSTVAVHTMGANEPPVSNAQGVIPEKLCRSRAPARKSAPASVSIPLTGHSQERRTDAKPSSSNPKGPSSRGRCLRPPAPRPTHRAAPAKPNSHASEDDMQALVQQFALVVVERDMKTQTASWVACKFCAVFGRTGDPPFCSPGRLVWNLHMFKAPLTLDLMYAHMRALHRHEFRRYELLPDERKAEVFEGRTLPPVELIMKRLQYYKSIESSIGHKSVKGLSIEEKKAYFREKTLKLQKKIAKIAARNDRLHFEKVRREKKMATGRVQVGTTPKAGQGARADRPKGSSAWQKQ